MLLKTAKGFYSSSPTSAKQTKQNLLMFVLLSESKYLSPLKLKTEQKNVKVKRNYLIVARFSESETRNIFIHAVLCFLTKVLTFQKLQLRKISWNSCSCSTGASWETQCSGACLLVKLFFPKDTALGVFTDHLLTP